MQNTISTLLLQNTTLDDSPWHQWCEKRYNEIALGWLVGTEPDSAATADLRQIAQTCLNEGGRAVLGARGICEVWLKEHYDENGCQSAPHGRGAERTMATNLDQSHAVRIVPKAANEVRIFLQNLSTGAQRVEIRNTSGQLIYTGLLSPKGELVIPVTGWHNGLYIAKVIGKGENYIHRFVVQHP